MLERNKRMLGYRRLFQEGLRSKTKNSDRKKNRATSPYCTQSNWTATWFHDNFTCATFVPSKRKQYKSIEVSSNDSLIHASF